MRLSHINFPSTALAVLAVGATSASDAERIALLPAIAYGALIVSACTLYVLSVTLKLLSWLEVSRMPNKPAHQESRYNPRRWANLAGVLLLGWALVALEQLAVEQTTTPKATLVQLTRTDCSSHRPADKNGNWCFYISGPETNELAERYIFRLHPTTFTPAPSIGGATEGWLLSYRSPVFGADAYSMVTSRTN